MPLQGSALLFCLQNYIIEKIEEAVAGTTENNDL